MMRWLGALLLAAILIAGLGLWRLQQPYRGFGTETFVEIPRGASFAQIANQLAAAGVIRAPLEFYAVRLTHRKPLQAGEYRFAQAASPIAVYERLARGDVFHLELIVPEGKNLFEIAEIAAGLGLFPAPEFVAAARNPALIRDLAPQAQSLEGYLFPTKYRIRRRTSAEQLCRIMTQQFRTVWKQTGAREPVHETVTLASVVEKEAKLPEERTLVAAVYRNRLRLGMKLDADPTTIYAALLEGRWRGTIYRSDLDSPHPYNTYRNRGLPPGPIANPGLAALQAALEPAESNAIFFVAKPDGSGGHIFSSDLASHNSAVSAYRRGQKR